MSAAKEQPGGQQKANANGLEAVFRLVGLRHGSQGSGQKKTSLDPIDGQAVSQGPEGAVATGKAGYPKDSHHQETEAQDQIALAPILIVFIPGDRENGKGYGYAEQFIAQAEKGNSLDGEGQAPMIKAKI